MNLFSSEGSVRTHILAIKPVEYMLEAIMSLITRAGIRDGAIVSGCEVVVLEFPGLHLTRSPGAPGIAVLSEKVA